MCATKKWLYFLVAIFLFFVCGGCRKETSDLLKGKWQLKTVEIAGIISAVDTVWYNFQSESLFMYQVYYAEKDSFTYQYGFKTHSDGHTLLLELTSYPRPVKNFLPVTDWEDYIRTFTVEKIEREKLILVGGEKKYVFEKF